MIKAPNMVIIENGLTNYIDEFTENMRKWLAVNVFSPLATRIEQVDLAFKQQSISELDCTNSTLADGLANAIAHHSTGGYNLSTSIYSKPNAVTTAQSSKPRSLIELRQAYPSNPVVCHP